MGISCWIMGHDFELTNRTKEENGTKYICLSCVSCGKEKWVDECIICKESSCIKYVVGINRLQRERPKREYSQRCYRCPRCGKAWHDEDKVLLEGVWYAVDGRAIHASEMADESPSLLDQFEECKSIRDVRALIQNVRSGSFKENKENDDELDSGSS